MIIKRLTLHNFGIYADDNTYEFKYRKTRSVSLIGGMNGRGKTTFLEAVLLALYGQNSFAVAESKYKTYGEYLRAHVNSADGTNKAFVELEFDMDENNDNNTYTVTRMWNSNGKRIKDTISVKKNNVNDTFLTQNWTMFIESILPSGLANFFFFDGEKIAELAETGTDSGMKDSIKSLLGINVIDILQSDLNRILKRVNDEKVDQYNVIRIHELESEKENKEEQYNAILSEIEHLNQKLEKTESALVKHRGIFEAKGGNIASQSKDIFSERIRLKSQLEQLCLDYEELASGILPLALVKPLLIKIQAQCQQERETKNMNLAVDTINKILKSYSGEKSEISKFINFVKNQTVKSHNKPVFNFSENAYSQIQLLNDADIADAKEAYRSRKNQEEQLSKRINEIDNYLSVDIDEDAIKNSYKKICELEATKIQLETQLETKSKERTAAHGELIKSTTEFNRCVETSLKTMEREDDLKRLRIYAMMAQNVSEKYKIELQKSKVQELAKTMTECSQSLLGKRHFINRIEMNPETLDYFYIDKEGNEIPKNSLSAGEKQLMVISMLWALAKCSGKNLPIIIDTPLARLDSIHRLALINRYFPNASKQTIILSTDVEIDAEYYNKMEKYVGNEFTLVYDDELKKSTIENGYFKGVIE